MRHEDFGSVTIGQTVWVHEPNPAPPGAAQPKWRHQALWLSMVTWRCERDTSPAPSSTPGSSKD